MQSPHTSAQERKWANTSFADHSPGLGAARNCAGISSSVSAAMRCGVAASIVSTCALVSDRLDTVRSSSKGESRLKWAGRRTGMSAPRCRMCARWFKSIDRVTPPSRDRFSRHLAGEDYTLRLLASAWRHLPGGAAGRKKWLDCRGTNPSPNRVTQSEGCDWRTVRGWRSRGEGRCGRYNTATDAFLVLQITPLAWRLRAANYRFR